MRHSFSPGSGFFAVEIKCNKLQDIINKLEGAVGNLLTLLTCVSRQEGEINGVSGPHLVITGCNVHIRSGSGATNDTTNLGNWVIGYNEPRGAADGSPPDTSNRTGSHTLIIGPEHQFTAPGGLLAGFRNTGRGGVC